MFRQGELLNGTYKITESIGSGGGGEIYKAYHTHLDCYVAVKLIKDNIKGKLDDRAEADILKKIKHSYLPQVYDFVITDDGDVYTVMEFIEGSSFQELINKGKKFTQSQILKYSKQICDALSYLHSRKPAIVHSDIKPANIMLTPEDNICIIDFNISSVLSEGGAFAVGKSDGYSPPEQYVKKKKNSFSQDERTSFYATDIYSDKTEFSVSDKTEFTDGTDKTDTKESSSYVSKAIVSRSIIDERSDIYALGATLYYLLTGKKPEKSVNYVTPIRKVGRKLRKGFLYIIGKAMQKSPDKRYQSIEEMLADFNNINEIEKKIKRKSFLKITGYTLLIILILLCIVALAGILTFRGTLKIYNKDGSYCLAQYDEDWNLISDSFYDEKDLLKSIYEYDSEGKTIKQVSCNPDGEIETYWLYEYDANGNRIKESYYNADNTLRFTRVYEYNVSGDKLYETIYDSNGMLYCSYKYDANGNRVKEDTYKGGSVYLNNNVIPEYDLNGNKAKEKYLREDGTLDYYYTYEYDSDGNLIKESCYFGNGMLDHVYEYDSNGNKIKENRYFGNGTLNDVYEYDSNGNKIKESRYYSDGTLNYYLIYEYDSDGNKIKESSYNEEGAFIYYCTYEYDLNGNKIKQSYYDSDGTLDWYLIYEYDSNGNLIKESWYNDNGVLYDVSEYDSKGNEIKESRYYSDGTLQYTYEYNLTGKRIKEIHYNPDGSVKNEYTY
ncbi:MAG: protein kinase [Oscillospiraceae bacterium]|nr:protein kinase [Oscillospiraceae bacterium]